MHSRVSWLGDVAANPRLSNATARLAVAIAASADQRGRYRGRALALAAAAQQSSRHQKDSFEALVREGFVRLHRHQGGRVDVEIIAPQDEVAPISEKLFRELSGQVVGVITKNKTSVVAYIDGDAAMVKLTLDRSGVEAIVNALGSATEDRAGPTPL